MKKAFLGTLLAAAATCSWAFYPKAADPAGHMMVISNVTIGFDAQASIITIGPDGAQTISAVPGTLGGHRRTKIYGRLDCPSARRAIDRGGYVQHRVFFLDALKARAAGYRPCAVCLPDEYRVWRLEGFG